MMITKKNNNIIINYQINYMLKLLCIFLIHYSGNNILNKLYAFKNNKSTNKSYLLKS